MISLFSLSTHSNTNLKIMDVPIHYEVSGENKLDEYNNDRNKFSNCFAECFVPSIQFFGTHIIKMSRWTPLNQTQKHPYILHSGITEHNQ